MVNLLLWILLCVDAEISNLCGSGAYLATHTAHVEPSPDGLLSGSMAQAERNGEAWMNWA